VTIHIARRSVGTKTRRPRRILIVDPHEAMRSAVVCWIDRTPDLRICGQAATVAEALRKVVRLKPDLVLTELALDEAPNFKLITWLHQRQPRLPVLVFSVHDESVYARRALQAGARGYLVKYAGGQALLAAIRRVLHGQIALSRTIRRQVGSRSGRSHVAYSVGLAHAPKAAGSSPSRRSRHSAESPQRRSQAHSARRRLQSPRPKGRMSGGVRE